MTIPSDPNPYRFKPEAVWPTERFLSPANLRTIILDATSSGAVGEAIPERPLVVAIDGRSASGKSTLARALSAERGWITVGTDDVAWWHSFFGWSTILIDAVISPARRGESVSFRPEAWVKRGREGAILIPKGTEVLVVEGVGASRKELQPYLDFTIWLHTHPTAIERREAERARRGESTASFQMAWMSEEVTFLKQDQPWTRADLILTAHPTNQKTYQIVSSSDLAQPT